MASSSYNQTSLSTRWDVFLSFRGIDTRYTFTDFLYEALQRTGIQTFKDDPEIRNGDVISDSLLQAIHESKTYVVILSKNYAASSWCLDELSVILDFYEKMKRSIIVVFYKIDPSDVRHQNGSYGKAFEQHEIHFDTARLDKWRATLYNVGNLSGYRVCKNMSQIDIINKVVHRVLLEINPTTLEVAKYPVGLDSRVKDISALLSSDSECVIKIGLHGMGGIGKTTLAKAVYKQNNQFFQGSCFLANVREDSVTEKGLVCLQQQLIDDVLKCKTIKIHNIDQGIGLIKERICSTKVLIVIDDLDDAKALEFLAGPFASGSVIIITTRNEDLLDSINVQARYKVKELDGAESRQLFTKHAFGENNIFITFTDMIDKIIERAGGLPLALKVFGSNLFNQSEESWRWFIDKMERVSIGDVEKNLVVSFDALKLVDPILQDMFLDIACFFVGMRKEKVVKILETSYTFVNLNLNILQKRCLVTIDNGDKLEMHDLLREMGRGIARKNFPNEPEKHSRLWVAEEIFDVLKKQKGTKAVEGIISEGFDYQDACDAVSYTTETFNRMRKLRFLCLKDVVISGSFKQTFEDLRFFKWVHCPLKYLPFEFYPQKLVILELPSSKLRTIWELNMDLLVFENLKTLNMSFSLDLTATPDFIRLPCLETLDLSGCESLEDVHASVGCLVRLISLQLFGCLNLRSLPDNICNLRALEVLDIGECISLEALPVGLGKLESLKLLSANGLTVLTLPDSIGHLLKLVRLELSYNKNLETLPDSICNLRALEYLNIDGCRSLKALPTELGNIESLTWLHMDRLTVSTLPDSIGRLSNLEELSLSYNHHLENFPGSIFSLRSLKTLSISRCQKFEMLRRLDTGDATVRDGHPLLSLAEFPPNLKWMLVEKCTSMLLLNLSNLKQLELLSLYNCSNLREIYGLKELASISEIHLGGCNSFLMASTLTKRLFQIYSEFGRVIKIYTSEFPDWIRQSSNPAGTTLCVDLPPNVSHNSFLALILCFKQLGNYKFSVCSVNNSISGFVRTGRLIYNESLILIVPRTIFSVREGDNRIALTSEADLSGIHLLYQTEEYRN